MKKGEATEAMDGRFTKSWGRLVMPIIMAAAMGIVSVNAHAIDSNGELLVEEVEEKTEAKREGPGDYSEVYEVEDTDSLGLDVCFYIRKNVENSLIPDEPTDQPKNDYSTAIRVNNAVSSYSFVYDNNIISNLCDDGYTASNSVRDALNSVPSAAEIQNVYPSFDPKLQYVFWYVIKQASTSYPNRDVNIHVDGVVLPKDASGETTPDTPDIPDDPPEPETPIDSPDPATPTDPENLHVETDLEFEIFSGNVESPFEYDGEEHLIGGYMIRVTDRGNGDVAEYTYGPYGDFRGVVLKKLSAASDVLVPGTTFNFMGMAFNVNIDSAYLLVKNPGNYEIPFFFGGQQISAADIIIRDETGRILDGKIDIKTPTVDNAVSQRRITITAGSTVQNDNGSTITNNSVTVSSGSLLPGHKLVTSIVGSQTGPGESVNEITYYDIVDSEGNSYKAMYDVTRENGWLILVKPSGSAASADDSEVSTVQTVIANNENSAVVLGAQRNADGSTGLLTKDGASIDKEGAPSDENGSDAKVLGARRSETSDSGIPNELRIVLIVLCLMAITVINIRKSKN